MVKTTVEKLSPTRTKLTISVTPEELEPSIKHAYEHIAEQVTIPGFRKGKVPPPIIDQRVGKAAVLEHAVNEGLDTFYRQAVEENDVRPLGRPQADITEWPNEKDFSGDLLLTIEVDTRPEVTLPDFGDVTLTVDAAEVSVDDVEEELDRLRSRFGTLVTVERPAKTGDFAQIDLVAVIGDEEVDTAANISYELGSGELIDGIDEALDTLTAGETTTFEAPLMGGDHEGEKAQITVTLNAVKERELPEADDDFAQIASEFDTIGELRTSLRTQVERAKAFGQGTAARDQLVDKLLELVEIPVPAQLVEDEVHRHLEQENRLEDDEHRAEVTESSEKTFRTQILLDEVARGREDQGQPGRAHPVPRAGRRPVRHGPERVRQDPQRERPDPVDGRRGRPQQGARDHPRQDRGRRHRRQEGRPLRVRRPPRERRRGGRHRGAGRRRRCRGPG